MHLHSDVLISFCCIMLPLCTVQHDLHSLCVRLCLVVYLVSHMQWIFLDLDPGVPYTVTVSASTVVGIGEPVSIVVFSMQQGKIDHRPCAKNCDVQNLCVRNTQLLKIL